MLPSNADDEIVQSSWCRADKPKESQQGNLILRGNRHLSVGVGPALQTTKEMFSPKVKLYTLLGRAPDGREFTLEGCTPGKQSMRLGSGTSSETWNALRGYEGLYEARPHAKKVIRIDFQIQGLAGWWGVQGVNLIRSDKEAPAVVLPSPRSEEIRIPKVARIKLKERMNQNFDHNEGKATMSVDAFVQMTFPKPIPLRLAEHRAEVFRFFLCLSAGRPLAFTWQKLHVVGKDEPIERLLRLPGESSHGIIASRQFGFRFSDIRYRRHAAVTAWYEIDRLRRPAMDLLTADIYDQTGIASGQLLSMANALEGYHRRLPGVKKKNPATKKDWDLIDRLSELVKRSETVLPSSVNWSNAMTDLKDARNYHSHYFAPSDPKRKKLTIQNMQDTISRARTLLRDQVYQDIGLKISKRKELAKLGVENQSLVLPGVDASISF